MKTIHLIVGVKNFMDFNFSLYRIRIHCKAGDTILIHDSPYFSKFLKSQLKNYKVLETLEKEDCINTLQEYDSVQCLGYIDEEFLEGYEGEIETYF